MNLPLNNIVDRIGELPGADRPLNVKLGIDPTAPDLHLGHYLLIRKLMQFAEAGHRCTIVLGDFTARIGDPSGRTTARSPLSKHDIDRNIERIKKQITRAIDYTPGNIKVLRNSGWLKFESIFDLMQGFTVQQMLAKDSIAQRFAAGKPITLTEFIYPLLQGMDSLELSADIELGGTDQRFNITIARDVQQRYGGRPIQCGLLMPLLLAKSGEKMSKSLGNTINLSDDAYTMKQKLMALSDEMVDEYIRLFEIDEIGLVTPQEKQRCLAGTMTGWLCDPNDVQTVNADDFNYPLSTAIT